MVMISSSNKKQLQEQVARLTNEIEELRLEREESKKNVLHFMQEADTTRQELKKAYKIMEGFNLQQGYLSPPPESEDIEASPSSSSTLLKLVSKLSLLDQDKLLALLAWVDETDHIPSLSQLKSAQVSLQEELEQLQDEYHATRGALQIENERAETLEKRWKESENALEQAESTLQSLSTELGHLRQQQECSDNNNKATDSTDIKLSQDLCRSRQDLAITVKHYNDCKVKLEETELTLKHWQTKYDEMNAEHTGLVSKQSDELNQAKIRENYLKTINKTLRDEVRKISKVQEDLVNIEYLRNVIIKFLERKCTRAQLIPILTTLLKCTREDQTRLVELVRNRAIES
ncbi:Bifunctional purine biosynthesis protein PurH [Mucor velutinosus]|uniref:Bifunctional purine biosynthesis protein PurH n=1 Tax=Mucor velutinosus TaxID=708070 RepID=A0AAN7DL94_9FUNG|nr:Bifunctional purine biosynthesis protein PurH [Mucor velutinosus]